MSAKLIDGKKLAAEIRKDCAARVRTLAQHDVTPGLAVILVGDDAASAVYVGKKIKACENVGIRSFTDRYPADITNEALLSRIEELNADENVHGILVQLPLPAHIDMAKVLETIAVDKDVDGFHLYNVGGLVTGNTVFSPCTPYGVVKLLESENIPIEGQNVVVVGASNIVGKPMALMLMAREHPQGHIDISRGSTALLVQALRDRTLDALVLDIRSLQPATDLKVEALQEMKGTFMCRKQHPLAKKRSVSFDMLVDYPIASTPLSDEVARILMERFGPQGHPDELVNLRCEEISSLLEVVRHSDAIVLAIRAAAPDLVELPVTPALNAKARFGLVTIAGRTEAPLLAKVRTLMETIMKDPH